MNKLQEIFSNREIALLIWFGIIILFILTKKSIRNSLPPIIKLLFSKYFLIIYLTFAIYLFGLFHLLKAAGFWTTADIKDSIFWILSVALILIFNLNKAKDSEYFKKNLINTIKIIGILEFIINFYNFSLIIELILIPIITFIGMSQAVASMDEKYKQADKRLSNFMATFGIGLLVYSIYKMTKEYTVFFTIETLHSFIFPIILTVLFLPYLYFLSLYSIYESYFIRLDFMTIKKEKVKEVKKLIIRRANININRLNRIMNRFDKSVFYNETDLKKYIKQISEK